MRRLGRSGTAAMELALTAPVLVLLLVAACDYGAVMLSKARIAAALASASQYASMAGQNGIATATIQANATAYATAVSSPFLGTPTTTATVNNGAASGSKCCLGGAWSCSTAANFTCADGSTPAVYLKLTVSYPFKALSSIDTRLIGLRLTDSVVAVLQ